MRRYSGHHGRVSENRYDHSGAPQEAARFVPMWNYMGLGGGVLTITTVIVVLTRLFSALAPALQASRPNLKEILTDNTPVDGCSTIWTTG